MQLDQYQVNAFTTRPFGGNPAAVVPLQCWLPDHVMQAIAAENNLSETAFYLPQGSGFALRWFTPAVEVNLCGHATLATAHVLFNELQYAAPLLRFATRSGELLVSRAEQAICLDLPVHEHTATELAQDLATALGGEPVAAFASHSNIVLYRSEEDIKQLRPDMRALLAATDTTTIVTAPGEQVDFVSRFFGPQVGVDEDPVTGSAHCALTPLWAQRLGKRQLSARQVSSRLGELKCELAGDRVHLTGTAKTFLRGKILLEL